MTPRQFLFVVIITCITCILWVVFDILHTRSQVTIDAETQLLIEPVNPTLDVSVIE